MNSILDWLTSPEWAQVVKTLLHSLWQAGLVALVLGLLLRRIASPAWRYRFVMGALVGVLVASLVSWAVLNQLSQHPETFPQTVLLPVAPLAEQGSPAPDPIGEPIVFRVAATKLTGGDSVKAGWTAWLALMWLTGALVMVIRAGVQVAGAERLRRSCKPLADERVTQLLEEAQRAMQLARRVRIAVTDKLTSPAVVGMVVPTLILPLALLTALTPEQLRFVLLHELAHIRRGDYFANLFQLFMEALLFFNPAVWWISHLVRREREACCDALAIELSGAPVDYAKTLVQVAENVLSPAPAAATAFGDGQREPSSLSDRVHRLLVPGYRPALRLTWRAMLAALLVGGALLFLSALGARNVVGAVASNATESAVKPEDKSAINEQITFTRLGDTTNITVTYSLKGKPPLEVTYPFGGPNGTQQTSGPIVVPSDGNTAAIVELGSQAGMFNWTVDGEDELAKKWFWYRIPNGQSSSNMPVEKMVLEKTDELNFYTPTLATNTGKFSPGGFHFFQHSDVRDPEPSWSTASSGSSSKSYQTIETNFQSAKLFTRTFMLDLNVVSAALGVPVPARSANESKVVSSLAGGTRTSDLSLLFQRLWERIQEAGVDLQPSKFVFLSHGKGQLYVHATMQDLDAIGSLVQALNIGPQMINLKTSFIEVPAEQMQSLLQTVFTNAPDPGTNQFMETLSEARTKALLSALKTMPGVDVYSCTEVTTLSGRQAQVQVAGVKTSGSEAKSVQTNGAAQVVANAEPMSFGPMIDVFPTVMQDGHTIQMRLIPTVNEFVGFDDRPRFYDSPVTPRPPQQLERRALASDLPAIGSRSGNSPVVVGVTQPVPRYRIRRVTTAVSVWDGQTVLFGNIPNNKNTQKPEVPVLGELPKVGKLFRSESSKLGGKRLILLITPTLVDPAGNRVYPGVQVDDPVKSQSFRR